MIMTDAPKTIWASLTAVRDGWYQTVNTKGGQRGFQNTEYTRADTVAAQLNAAVLAEREACASIAENLAAACDRNYMPKSACHLEMAASDIRDRKAKDEAQ